LLYLFDYRRGAQGGHEEEEGEEEEGLWFALRNTSPDAICVVTSSE